MILDIILEFLKTEPSLCAFPLIPALVIAAIGLLAVGIVIISTKKDPVKAEQLKEKGICILGPEASGKTQLLSSLRNIPYTSYRHSQQEPYKEFDINIAGENIKIKAGFDIGGEEFRIKSTYNMLIENSDIVFFTFDAHKYLNNKEYQVKDVNSRLYWIYIHKGNKPMITFGTHLDEFSKSDRKDVINRIQNAIKDKSYSTLLEKNFVVMDLRESTELKKYLQEVIIR